MEDPYRFILHNGIEHEDMINDLGFEEIADDLLFPSPGTIPVLNARQNRGFTIGFTGSQSAARNPTSGGIRHRLPRRISRVFVAGGGKPRRLHRVVCLEAALVGGIRHRPPRYPCRGLVVGCGMRPRSPHDP